MKRSPGNGLHVQHQQTGYRPDIDGLRGVAILAVLANHANRELVPGGFIGVDVFFVISGFLITSIIRRDIAEGSFSFASFYSRRVKRLMPAASVMVAVVTVLGCFLFLPLDLKDLGASVIAYAGMASNVLFWKWDDYFASQQRFWPLLHTWSLSVEEQFYLAYPLLLVTIVRLSPRVQILAISTIAAISFGMNLYETTYSPRSAYYLLPSRAWELATGAVATYLPIAIQPRWATTALRLVSILVIACSMWLLSETFAFPGWAAVPPVVATAVLIWLNMGRGDSISAWITWRPLIAIGRISYSLYLWHWPLIVFAKYPWSAHPDAVPWCIPYAATLVAFPISWVSYRFIETPARVRQFPRWRVPLYAAVACGLLIAFGAVAYVSRGLPQRLPEKTVKYESAWADRNPRAQETFGLPAATIRSGQLPVVGDAVVAVPPHFALCGDSHADALVACFDVIGQQQGVGGTVLACGSTLPFPGSGILIAKSMDGQFADAAISRLERDAPPQVVFAARWMSFLKHDFVIEGRLLTTDRDKTVAIRNAMHRTAARLLSAGVQHIWIVRQIPDQPFNVPRQLAIDALLGRALSRSVPQPDHDAAMHDFESGLFQDLPEHVGVIDLPEWFYREFGGSLLTPDDWPLYHDSHHLSFHGAKAVRAAFLPVFRDNDADEDRRYHPRPVAR